MKRLKLIASQLPLFPEAWPESHYDEVGQIIAYEQGELGVEETKELFSHLIKFGTINHLQGSYQRNARWMIQAGWFDRTGNILPGIE